MMTSQLNVNYTEEHITTLHFTYEFGKEKEYYKIKLDIKRESKKPLRTNLLLFLLLGGAQDLLPLGEHVEVHGREEGDVQQHDDHHHQGEGECGVQPVGQLQGQHAGLAGVTQAGVAHQQLPRHAHRVGHREESVPVRRCGYARAEGMLEE